MAHAQVHSAADLSAAYQQRFAHASPEPVGGTLDSLAASGDGTVDQVQAASVRSYSQPTDTLRFVKAKKHFLEAGEPVFAGDYVELKESVAKALVSRGFAEFATEEEVAAASKPAKK